MPEVNLIQHPELIDRVRKALGLRQAHVLSTLNEGVQAVVLIDDLTLRQRPSDTFRDMIGNSARFTNDGGGVNILWAGIGLTAGVGVPGGGRRMIRLKRVMVYCNSASKAGTLITWGPHSPWPPTGFVFGGGPRQFAHPTAQEAIQSVQPGGISMGIDNAQPPGAITHGAGGTGFWHPPSMDIPLPEMFLTPQRSNDPNTVGFLVGIHDITGAPQAEWVVQWIYSLAPFEES